MKQQYHIYLSSPPDRNKLVSEIFFDNIQWVEINKEGDDFEIEFYSRPDGLPWKISFSEAIHVLNEAKEKLSSSMSE